MNKRLAIIALLAVTASAAPGAARAKPTPPAPVRLTPSPDETAMVTGPAGATLESDYFRAPQRPLTAGRAFQCQLRLFDKVQFAQSCR